MRKEDTTEKVLKLAALLAIAIFSALLFPPARDFVTARAIEFGERLFRRSLGSGIFDEKILEYSLIAILCSGAYLVISARRRPIVSDRYREKILMCGLTFIIAISIAVRIVMYIKCRSLWLDEAMLAESIVTRGWSELLASPLSYNQSAPIFYVIGVKAICAVAGYAEPYLRLFSMFAFIAFLACEYILLKKTFGLDRCKAALVTSVCALLPVYIWYSSELKPYMNDALFAALTMFMYSLYLRGKLKLPALTFFFILSLGFSSPALFFAGGALLCEFFSAAIGRNKKKALCVCASGIAVIVTFALYYSWWMAPASDFMTSFWDGINRKEGTVGQILRIFSPSRNSDSSYLWIVVPFALIGLISQVRSGNKIARMAALSLLLVLMASLIGMWPLAGRLWLFLPVVVLSFTPVGIDILAKRGRIAGNLGSAALWGIMVYLSINCMSYLGEKMYIRKQEINPLIAYVQANIKDGETLYVFAPARHTLNYRNGYNANRIGNVSSDNIMIGKSIDEWSRDSVGGELKSILEYERVYLIFSYFPMGIGGGLSGLRNHGTLTKVMESYETPLYYFVREPLDNSNVNSKLKNSDDLQTHPSHP